MAGEEIGLTAVSIDLEPRPRFEIDVHTCTYPTCVVCMLSCPAPGSIVEAETGRSLVPPPPDLWRDRPEQWLREVMLVATERPKAS